MAASTNAATTPPLLGGARSIAVVGNIGSGKSTLCARLAAPGSPLLDAVGGADALCVHDEPVKSWHDTGLLARYYIDKRRYAYVFQSTVTMDRMLQAVVAAAAATKNTAHLPKVTPRWHLWDGHPMSDRHVYAEKAFDDKDMDAAEWRWYQHAWDAWTGAVTGGICGLPTVLVYVRAPVDACRQRVIERDRIEERDAVSPEYLYDLQRRLDGLAWYPDGTPGGHPLRVLRVDGAADAATVAADTAAQLATLVRRIDADAAANTPTPSAV